MAITCKNAITIRVDPLWTAIVDIVVVGRGRKDGTVDDAWPGPANTHPSTSELPLATASAMINLSELHGRNDAAGDADNT